MQHLRVVVLPLQFLIIKKNVTVLPFEYLFKFLAHPKIQIQSANLTIFDQLSRSLNLEPSVYQVVDSQYLQVSPLFPFDLSINQVR